MRFLAVVITLLFIIVGVKLCLTGDKMYEDAQVFTAPEHVDYATFARDRPLVGWYEVSGAIVDLTEGAYRSAQGNSDSPNGPAPDDYAFLNRSREVYVPAYDQAGHTKAADIILYTRDQDLVNAVKAQAAGQDTRSHVTAPRIIRGMVRTPSELPDRVRRALGSAISTQSIIIEEYASPSSTRAIQTMAAGGAMILFVTILWLAIWRHDRRPVEIPDEYLPESMVLEEQ